MSAIFKEILEVPLIRQGSKWIGESTPNILRSMERCADSHALAVPPMGGRLATAQLVDHCSLRPFVT